MGMLSAFRGQFRSVICWDEPAENDLFTLWSDNGEEIKNASSLIVAPGQGCLFVYEGRVQALFDRPGRFVLQTDNIPFWTTISRVLQFFESEHKTALFFYRKTEILNQKWGTSSTIKYLDPHYNFPVALRAYGNFSCRIVHPKEFFTSIVGARPRITTEDMRLVMADRILQPLTDALAEARLSYSAIDARRQELSERVSGLLLADFERLGFELTDFRIEGATFDEATMRRIDRIADVTAEALAAQEAGVDFSRLQQMEALREAARNEGGAAGIGVGMGVAAGMGQAMGAAFISPSTPRNQQSIPERLGALKALFEQQLITDEEYRSRKQQILAEL
jgi:membrane protease subunit (stomatin/prohibitin family)